MRLGQTSAIYFISKVLASAFGFVATVYLSRVLGEEILGFYGVALSLVFALVLVGNIGFGGAITKRISEGEEPEAYFTAGLLIKTSLFALTAVGVLVFESSINSYVGRDVAIFIILMMGGYVFLNLIRSGLKGNHLVHVEAPLNALKQALRSVFMIGLVIMGWELSGMLLGHFIGTLLVATIGTLILRPSITIPRLEHFTRLLDFAKFSWLGSLRQETFSRADILVLGYFVSSGLTGIYVVAYTLAEFLDIFGRGISTTLFPEISRQAIDGNIDVVRGLTNDALSFAGLILIPGTVGATVIGDRVMRVYGEGFRIGGEVLTLLLIALTIYTYTKQLLNTLNAIDRPDLAFRANGVFVVTNILLNIFLVYSIGWVGAAFATALSAAVGLVLAFRYTWRELRFEVPIKEIVFQTVAALLMGGVVYVVRGLGEAHWIANWNIPFVLLLVGVGASIYFGVLLLISERFRTTVLRNLPDGIPMLG